MTHITRIAGLIVWFINIQAVRMYANNFHIQETSLLGMNNNVIVTAPVDESQELSMMENISEY